MDFKDLTQKEYPDHWEHMNDSEVYNPSGVKRCFKKGLAEIVFDYNSTYFYYDRVSSCFNNYTVEDCQLRSYLYYLTASPSAKTYLNRKKVPIMGIGSFYSEEDTEYMRTNDLTAFNKYKSDFEKFSL